MMAVTAAEDVPLYSIQARFLVLEFAPAFTAISAKETQCKTSREDPKLQMAPNPVLHLCNFNALSVVECTSQEGCKKGFCRYSEDKSLFPSHGFTDRRFVTPIDPHISIGFL